MVNRLKYDLDSVFSMVAAEVASLVPKDQRDAVKERFIFAAKDVLPKAEEKLDFTAEKALGTKYNIEEAEFVLVRLDSIHLNLDDWRTYYGSTGRQNAPWNGLKISDRLYAFAIALKDPEPTPKVNALEFKLNVKDYGYIPLDDLRRTEEPNRVLLLSEYIELPQKATIESSVNVVATGYDSLQFIGGAFVRAEDAVKRDKTTFY